jgi:hypothetical protein
MRFVLRDLVRAPKDVGAEPLAEFSRSLSKRLLTLTAGVSALAITAGCTSPVPPESGDQLSLEAAKLDFAYDATVDHIGYMSCSGMSPGSFDTSAFFSYRLGAYRKGGVRLTDEFRNANRAKTVEKLASLMVASPANSETHVQLAFRRTSNLQSMYARSATPTHGEDYVNIFEQLGTVDLAELMVKADPDISLRYLRNGSVFGSRFEGSLHFSDAYGTTDSMRREQMNRNAMLTITYSQKFNSQGNVGGTGGSTDTLARSPKDVDNKSLEKPEQSVYGRGLNLTFSQPTDGGSPHTSRPSAILNTVSERSLRQGQTTTQTWTCPSSLRFKIARASDVKAGRTTCSMAGDPETPTDELSRVRHILRPEDWYVDMVNKCIVSKKGESCYAGANSDGGGVNYNITTECFVAGQTNRCVEFATICYVP